MPLPKTKITPIPAIDPATGEAPSATPDLFNTRFLEVDENAEYLDGEVSVIKQDLEDTGQRINDTNQALSDQADRINGLENDGAGSVSKAFRLDAAFSAESQNAMELFWDSWTLQPSMAHTVIEALAGDDSLDVDTKEELEIGNEYVVFDGVNQETFVLKEKLEGTRIRATANLAHTYTNAKLRRTSWEILGGKALAKDGGIYIAGPINLGDENQDKALVIRRQDNDLDLAVYFQDAARTEWTPVPWSWKRTVENDSEKMELEYLLPARQEFSFKIVATAGETASEAEVEFMLALDQETGLGGLHHPPITPTIVFPTDGATDIDEQPSITTSAYSHQVGTELFISEFEISSSDDFFAENVVDSGVVQGISYSPDADVLSVSTAYYARARHKDVRGGVSAWSPTISFTTASAFVTVKKPVGLAPAAGAELSSPNNLTLVSSAFATDGGADTHANSQWQISTDPAFGTTVHDSGTDSTNLTSYAVPDGNLERGVTYYWRVKHEGTAEGWSDWSDVIVFSVAAFTPFVTTLGGESIDQFFSVAVDDFGNIYAAGKESSSTGNTEALLAKVAVIDGALVWQKKFTGISADGFSAVAVDGSGNIYVAGEENSSAGNAEALLAKFAPDGSLGWQKKLGGSKDDGFYAIAIDTSGNVYVVGAEKSSTNGGNRALIARYASDGTLIWQKKIGSTGGEWFSGVVTDDSGNIYAVGADNSTSGNANANIVKYTSEGILVWQKSLGGTGNEYFRGVAVDNSGNIYAAGDETSSTGDANALIAKFSSDGMLVWQKVLGDSYQEYFYGVAIGSDGKICVVGKRTTSSEMALVAEFDSDGTLIWQKVLSGASGAANEQFRGVAIDSSGNRCAVGYENASTGNYEAVLASIDPNAIGVIPNITALSWVDPSLSVTDPALALATTTLPVGDPGLTAASSALAVGDPGLTQNLSEY